jgi:drug/metabolite transporter (DMT)-like permease
MPDSRTRNLALPALLVANMALACGPWLVRLARAQGEVGPVAAGFWRLVLALPIFLIVTGATERPKVAIRPIVFVLLGGVAFAADLAMWHVGILHTRLANATLLGNITALLFPLYGFWMARSWPHAKQWTAMALASVGTVLLLGRSYTLSADHLLGDMACIGAGLCYTGYLIAIDRSRGGLGPFATLTICGIAGTPLLLATAWGLGEPIWPHDWTALVLLTLGSQLIGQGLLIYGVTRAPPLIVGLMLLSQPIVASAIGWLVYGERLGVADAVGALGIAAAVLLVRDTRKREPLPAFEAGLSSAGCPTRCSPST